MKMRPHQWVFMTLFLVVMTACSEGEKTAPSEQTNKETAEDVWAAQRRPIDKAKAVEQQLMEADQRRREIEEQGY